LEPAIFLPLTGNTMHKAVCLIDGFNLYHGIAKLDEEKCKWCNYRKLAKRFLGPRQNLLRVVYFTAFHYLTVAGKHLGRDTCEQWGSAATIKRDVEND